MKFRYIVLMGMVTLSLVFALLLPGVFSQLRNTPEINYYKGHADLAYSVYSGCKDHPANIDDCYAAYSAAIYLASSGDCTPAGKEVKRRFKILVENISEKNVTEEIISDCQVKDEEHFFKKMMKKFS